MNNSIFKFDLEDPRYAYMYGFIQTDGHLQNKRKEIKNVDIGKGKVTVELGIKDVDILMKFQEIVPIYSSINYRTRDTNFSTNYTSATWAICSIDFRREIMRVGLPDGKKSLEITPPLEKFSILDYYRGLIDGDGSLGFTSAIFPFISIVTSSSHIADAYIKFLSTITGKIKTTSRNKRDGVFNIMITKEDAVEVAKNLYYPGSLSLKRKGLIAEDIISWIRPPHMTKKNFLMKKWNPDEDRIIQSYPLSESTKILNRTSKSVQIRLIRLKNNHKY